MMNKEGEEGEGDRQSEMLIINLRGACGSYAGGPSFCNYQNAERWKNMVNIWVLSVTVESKRIGNERANKKNAKKKGGKI